MCVLDYEELTYRSKLKSVPAIDDLWYCSFTSNSSYSVFW